MLSATTTLELQPDEATVLRLLDEANNAVRAAIRHDAAGRADQAHTERESARRLRSMATGITALLRVTDPARRRAAFDRLTADVA